METLKDSQTSSFQDCKLDKISPFLGCSEVGSSSGLPGDEDKIFYDIPMLEYKAQADSQIII